VLTTEEEGRGTLEYDGMYVITPHRDWWKQKNYKTGVPVPDGFTYASNTNPRVLTVKELRDILRFDLGSSDRHAASVGSVAQSFVVHPRRTADPPCPV
jgi:hypothetical protein